MKNKFCIRTRGPDHSKQIVDTLVRLGYDNSLNSWAGCKNKGGHYGVNEKNEILGDSSDKYPEIQLEDLEGNVKISFNYLIL